MVSRPNVLTDRHQLIVMYSACTVYSTHMYSWELTQMLEWVATRHKFGGEIHSVYHFSIHFKRKPIKH